MQENGKDQKSECEQVFTLLINSQQTVLKLCLRVFIIKTIILGWPTFLCLFNNMGHIIRFVHRQQRKQANW